MMTEAREPTNTTAMPGIYANGIYVTVQQDGMIRILFQDTIGGAAVERAHIVMTTAGAETLVNLVQTLIAAAGPTSAAN